MPGHGSQEIAAKIAVKRIDSAPVTMGEPWGPCLLAPGIDSEWTIGEWDGECWCARSGFQITPLFYAELPELGGAGGTINAAHDL